MYRSYKMIWALIVVFCMVLPVGALAVNSAETLIDAIQNSSMVTLTGSFELGQKIDINKEVVINGDGYTITQSDSYTGTLFNVTASGKLTLMNVTLDGGNLWMMDQEKYDYYLENGIEFASKTKPGVLFDTEGAGYPYVYPLASENGIQNQGATANMIEVGGQLILKNSTIQNYYSVKMSEGTISSGGVSYPCATIGGKAVINAKAGSNIIIEDSTIQHCASGDSGVVVHAGGKYTCTIRGNTLITDNFGGFNGGLINCYSGSTVIMEDGMITGNRGANSNGSVIALNSSGATFDMRDGEISKNSSLMGVSNGFNSAVYCHSGSTFKMSGGVIKENAGRSCGGIFFRDNAVKLEITGGSIINNHSYANGLDDIYNAASDLSKLSISGGTFTQDVKKWMDDGYIEIMIKEGMWKVCRAENVYRINYVLDGGTLQGYYPTQFEIGMDYELSIPGRNGAVFLGWTSDAIKKPVIDVKVTNAPAGDVTYYANWSAIELPETGDESSMNFWVSMLVMGIGLLLLIRKRAERIN